MAPATPANRAIPSIAPPASAPVHRLRSAGLEQVRRFGVGVGRADWWRAGREADALEDRAGKPHAALKLALEVAEKTGYENTSYLDTLSLAYHLTGDTAKAIENQKKAIALLPEGESRSRTGLEKALARFETALEGGQE